jgi:uncharacterized protein YjbI with pentapeptide repeats
MLVYKPSQCALITRPIEYKKRFGLCITNHLYISYSEPENPSVMSEQSMWKFVSEQLNPAMLDEAITKSGSEFHVCGSAFSSKQSPAACAASVQLGSIKKTVLVFGNRYWLEGEVSKPASFVAMPIDWQHAYGGADYPLNTQGMGRSKKDGVQWLPNIELPHERIINPNQKVAPAGFGLRDVTHPERIQYQGTYDSSYLKEHSPGFVPDIDWRYFNLSPQDQWFPKELVGNEAFTLENMHPELPIQSGFLPGLTTRALVSYESSHSAQTREVPMRLTTVWFFPNTQSAVLSFQGLAECSLDDGSDISQLILGIERLGEPQTLLHYQQVLEKRQDANLGAIHSLNDLDLLPQGVDLNDPLLEASKAPFAMEGLQMDAQLRKAQAEILIARQKAFALGKDPDALGLKMPIREKTPSVQELPAIILKQQAEFKKSQWDAVEEMVTHLERAIAHKKQFPQLANDLVGRGPPALKAAETLKNLMASTPSIPKADISALAPKLVAMDTAQVTDYLKGAHYQKPAKVLPFDEAQALRAEMNVASSKGIKYFAGVDFTGADFSNLDLREVDFSGAWLENVNFSGSNISRAVFVGAVLAHSQFEGVIAIDANFTEANLGRCIFNDAVLDGAIFAAATLQSSQFARASLRLCDLRHANIMEVAWTDSDLSQANLSEQIFSKADLKKVIFADSQLTSANFIECDLSGADMSGSNVSGATFYKTKLIGANLNSINAHGAIFVEGTDLSTATLIKANLKGANLGSICCESAIFREANLNGSNCTRTNFSKADLRLSSAVGVLGRFADLSSAKTAGSNFKDAILQNADLTATDFRKSNLFGADLSRVLLSGDTKFDGCVMTRTRTYPRLSVEQQASRE